MAIGAAIFRLKLGRSIYRSHSKTPKEFATDIEKCLKLIISLSSKLHTSHYQVQSILSFFLSNYVRSYLQDNQGYRNKIRKPNLRAET